MPTLVAKNANSGAGPSPDPADIPRSASVRKRHGA
jgi:hypothetical protein